MATQWTEPLVGPQATRRYTTNQDWTKERKDIIMKLRDQGKTIKEIQQVMLNEHSFDASIAMYKKRLKQWGARLHFNEKQRRFIIQQRERLGKMPKFVYTDTGAAVEEDKLQRLWNNRSRYKDYIVCDRLSPGGLQVETCQPESPLAAVIEPILKPTEDFHADDAMDEDEVELFRLLEADTSGPVLEYKANGSISNTSPASLSFLVALPRNCYEDISRGEENTTDDEIDQFIIKILKMFNIPLDCHLQRSHGGNTACIPSFEEWEKNCSPNPKAAVAVSWSPNSSLGYKIEMDLTPNGSYYDLFSLLPAPGNQMILAAYGSPNQRTTARGILDLKTMCALTLEELIGSPEDLQRIDEDRAHVRTKTDLTENEKQELRVVKRELKNAMYYEMFFRLQFDKEELLEVYRRLLGRAASETLIAERIIYTRSTRLGRDYYPGYYCRRVVAGNILGLKSTYRRHWRILGPDHPSTRDCLNGLAKLYSIERDRSMAYVHTLLALNGRDPYSEQLDETFDHTALETLEHLACELDKRGQLSEAIALREEIKTRGAILKERFLHLSQTKDETAATTLDTILDSVLESYTFRSDGLPLELMKRLWPVCVAKHGIQSSKSLYLGEKFSWQLENLGCLEAAQRFRSRLHGLFIRKVTSEWTDSRLCFGIRNLERLGSLLHQRGEYVGALKLFEQNIALKRYSMLRTGVHLEYYFNGDLENIADALIKRGPTLYIQPLLYHCIERREQSCGALDCEVARLIILYGEMVMKFSNIAMLSS